MKQVRQGVFETNSSSTHSLVICTKKDYDAFNKGDAYWYNDRIYGREALIEALKAGKWTAKEFEQGLSDDEVIAKMIDEWEVKTDEMMGEDLEYFSESFTTPSGDEIVAFGYYGFDG